jgi:hypothetical protein
VPATTTGIDITAPPKTLFWETVEQDLPLILVVVSGEIASITALTSEELEIAEWRPEAPDRKP